MSKRVFNQECPTCGRKPTLYLTWIIERDEDRFIVAICPHDNTVYNVKVTI